MQTFVWENGADNAVRRFRRRNPEVWMRRSEWRLLRDEILEDMKTTAELAVRAAWADRVAAEEMRFERERKPGITYARRPVPSPPRPEPAALDSFLYGGDDP